ncbi:MAG: hypothetical protein ACKO1M_11280 [Planctomycetota bacterium]
MPTSLQSTTCGATSAVVGERMVFRTAGRLLALDPTQAMAVGADSKKRLIA